MKKIFILLLLCVAVISYAQQPKLIGIIHQTNKSIDSSNYKILKRNAGSKPNELIKNQSSTIKGAIQNVLKSTLKGEYMTNVKVYKLHNMYMVEGDIWGLDPEKIPVIVIGDIKLDKSQVNNLLSGLIGAIIAVFLVPFFEKIKDIIRLNNIRKTFLFYIDLVGLDKMKIYADDMEHIIYLIKEPVIEEQPQVEKEPVVEKEPQVEKEPVVEKEPQVEKEEMPKINPEVRSVDAMPMFTNDIFKSYTPNEIRRVSFNSKNYILMLDVFYSIEFLKANMPLSIYNDFLQKVNKHYDDKGLESPIEQQKHYNSCGLIRSFEKEAINEAYLKHSRAVLGLEQMKEIRNGLSGCTLWWAIKFLFV